MAKNNTDSIIIKDFQQGTAISPYFGFGYMSGADIFTIPGVVKCAFNPSIVSGTTVTDLVKWIKQDPNNPTNFYALDRSGNFYQSTSSGTTWSKITGNTTTSASGDGLEIWKGFAFVARNGKLDLLDLSASPLSSGWTSNWHDLNSANGFHPMLVGQDDILYIGNGSKLASVQYSGTTFVAGSAIWNDSACSLPTQYSIKCIGELGQNLMMGTIAAGGATTNKLADIFPWDRVSATFSLPIRMFDFGIHQMATFDNLLYFTAGQEHTLYKTNGYANQEVRKFGYNIAALSGGGDITLNPYPGALIKHRNRIMTGVSGLTGTVTGGGIWSIADAGAVNDYALNDIGSNIEVGALISTGPNTYLAGMRSATNSYAIYKVDTTLRQSATIHSPVIQVGTTLQPRNFSTINVLFDKNMDSSTSVFLYYRYTLGDNWVQVGNTSINTTLYGTNSHVQVPATITDARTIQIRADLTDGSNSGIGIKEIHLT